MAQYAMLLDAGRNVIGNAERSGDTWRGHVADRPFEAWRGNLVSVAKETCAAVVSACFVHEPIWRYGVVIC